MASQPDTSVQDHSLDAILAKMVPKYTRDGHDALFLVLHAFMISAGFRLVGLGDDGSIVNSTTLPENWRGEVPPSSTSTTSESSGASPSDSSASPSQATQEAKKLPAKDDWAFRYRHTKSSMTFVLKALRLGSRLSCHAYIVEQDDVMANVELSVPQFIDSASDAFKAMVVASTSDSPVTTWTPFLKDLAALHKQFKSGVMTKLMPEVEDLANQIRFSSNASNAAANPQPAAEERPPRDPLMAGDVRRPMRSPYNPHGDDPSGGYGYDQPGGFSNYGDDDLFGAPGRFGEGAGPQFRMGRPGMGGGSSVGPNHPGFGPVNDPYGQGAFGGLPPGAPTGPGPYAHPPPRGARFDPFGPPINPIDRPGSNTRDPNGPPGFDNWYS